MRIRWRNLELPTRVVVDRATLTDTYGMFTIEPFERGFGHTIGNGLRRVLLSSIEGTAATWMTIKGALHEFQPVEGVVEDVTDIVLAGEAPARPAERARAGPLRASKSEKGPVTGADFVGRRGRRDRQPRARRLHAAQEDGLRARARGLARPRLRHGRGERGGRRQALGSARAAARRKSTRKSARSGSTRPSRRCSA